MPTKTKLTGLLSLLALSSTPVLADHLEPVRMSEMTREQEVCMQSTSYPTLMWMLNLINEIKAYGGPEAEQEFFVKYETPMAVYSNEVGLYHTCIEGVHIMQDDNLDAPMILQIYDNYGEPTMMDD